MRTQFLLSALLVVSAACKGKKSDTTPKNTGDSAAAKVDGTLCETDGKRVAEHDLNKDGKPDVWRLYKDNVQTCKQLDFDHDGRKDWVEAYDASARPLYQKADFDYDGKFDMLTVLDPASGEPSEVERDTDFDGKFDVREVYAAGQLTSVRRDRNGDQKPDLWEQYVDGKVAATTYDDDFDGKVDRRDDGTGSGAVPAPAPATGSGSAAGTGT